MLSGTVLDSLSRQLVRPHGPRASLRVGSRIRWRRGTPMFHLYEALLLSGKLKRWEKPIKWGGESPVKFWWKKTDQKAQKQYSWWLSNAVLSLLGGVCGKVLMEPDVGVGDGAAAEELAEKVAKKLAEKDAEKDAKKDAENDDGADDGLTHNGQLVGAGQTIFSGKMKDIGYAPILWCTIVICTILFINSVIAAPTLTKVTAVVGLWRWISVSLAVASLIMFYRCSSKDPGFIKRPGDLGNPTDTEDPLLNIDLSNSSVWMGNWSQLCPTCKGG